MKGRKETPLSFAEQLQKLFEEATPLLPPGTMELLQEFESDSMRLMVLPAGLTAPTSGSQAIAEANQRMLDELGQ